MTSLWTSALLFAFLNGLSAFAADNEPSCHLAEVLKDQTNLRKAPSFKSKDSTKAAAGATFVVRASENDRHWAKVVEGEHKGRFLHLSTFKVKLRRGMKECESADGPAEVAGDRVNVRVSPSLTAPITGHLLTGDPLTVSSVDEQWLKISWPETHQGKFVHSDFVRLSLPSAASE